MNSAAIRERHAMLQARLISRLSLDQLQKTYRAICRIQFVPLTACVAVWATWFWVSYGPVCARARHFSELLLVTRWDSSEVISLRFALGILLGFVWASMTVVHNRTGWCSLKWTLRMDQTVVNFDITSDRIRQPLQPAVQGWESRIANDQCELLGVQYGLKDLETLKGDVLRWSVIALFGALMAGCVLSLGVLFMVSTVAQAIKEPWKTDGSFGHDPISKKLNEQLFAVTDSMTVEERKPRHHL